MMYKLGRILQVLGMLLLPAAIVGQEMEKFSIKGELVLLGIGVVVFMIGWRIQQAGRVG